MAAEKTAASTTTAVTPRREQLALALEKTDVQTPRASVTDQDQAHLDAKFKRRDDATGDSHDNDTIAAENYTSHGKRQSNEADGKGQQRKKNIMIKSQHLPSARLVRITRHRAKEAAILVLVVTYDIPNDANSS